MVLQLSGPASCNSPQQPVPVQYGQCPSPTVQQLSLLTCQDIDTVSSPHRPCSPVQFEAYLITTTGYKTWFVHTLVKAQLTEGERRHVLQNNPKSQMHKKPGMLQNTNRPVGHIFGIIDSHLINLPVSASASEATALWRSTNVMLIVIDSSLFSLFF